MSTCLVPRAGRDRPAAWLGLCLVALALAPGRAGAEDPAAPATRADVFPLASIRPGLRGHGLTVRSGTRVERFEVEVIDVIHHALVKQDLILVRCLGEDFADHQIAQGMSGSPVYFEGRCAGALAYTWAWAKHAVGGVTPIEALLAEGARPLEGRPTGRDPPTGPRRPPLPIAAEGGLGLTPIGLPLALGGYSAAGRAAVADALAGRGLVPCPGPGAPGGAGSWADRDAPVEPGSVLVVDLARGDFSAAVSGTVTFVDGEKVYGFGHPFDGLGETELPMSLGYAYAVVASRQISFKLSGSLRPIGRLVQDRDPGVVGVLGAPARMVPFRVAFGNAVTGRREEFRFEITPNTLFFQPLAVAALRDCFARAETTLGPNTKRVRMTVHIEGMEPWTFEDAVGGFDGGFQRTLIHLLDRPLNDEHLRVEFESFELEVEVEHQDRRAFVRSVTADRDEARPGETVGLDVLLVRKDGGAWVRERLEVRLPADAPAGNYEILVVGGDFVPAEVPAPVDIGQMPREYEAPLKSTDLVAVLPTARVDVDWEGHLLRRLPLSALPRIARSPAGTGLRLRPATERVVRAVPYVVEGRASVSVRVAR